MHTHNDNEFSALLTRHQQQRDRGLPTLSVVVGTFSTLPAALHQWATAAARETVRLTSLQDAVLGGAIGQNHQPPWGPLAHAAARHVTAALGSDDLPSTLLERLAHGAARERDVLLEAASHRLRPDLAAACVALLHPTANPITLPRLASAHSPLALCATDTKHVLFWWAPAPSDALETTVCDLQRALSWILAYPELPLVVLVPGAASNAAAQRLQGKQKTLWQSGLILAAGLASDATPPHPPPPRLLPESQTMTAPVKHANAVDAAVEQDDAARSEAERFLFAQLEGWPETRGIFELNRRTDIAWGEHHFLEIDLLCGAWRIAIEIDGYYHFVHPDAYRRDRRKDYYLQYHDYFVLRFFAEDVVKDIEKIRDTILQTMRRQKQRTWPDSAVQP